jgi:DNA gyrase subunit B
MLASEEIRAIITALGAGIGERFSLEKLRYHRVILMSDADVDGSHIRTLLLTFFYRHMQPLIDGGYLYIAQPPLYRVSHGKESRWVYSDKEKDTLVKEWGGNGKEPSIQRYKGLGEMNPEQLWETTMDPARRTLLQVTLDDALAAEEAFTNLMGDQVEPRKEFIQRHARDVRFLDI